MRTFTNEADFHRARRMFAVTDHGVQVAEPGDVRAHYEWLCSWFGPEATAAHFASTTRGYVLDGVLAAYKGHDFSRWVEYADVLLALDEMEKHCGPIERVWLGARRGEPGVQPWNPVVDCDAAEFRAMMATRKAGKNGDGDKKAAAPSPS